MSVVGRDAIRELLAAVERHGTSADGGLLAAAATYRDEIHAGLLAESLPDFLREAWSLVEPGTPFKNNWHLGAVCAHLEAVSRGEIRRLIINVPPRTAKSTVVAVAWPTWTWLTRPERRFLYASYAEKLSKRDSLKCRRIVESRGGRREGGTLLERIGYRGLLALVDDDPWKLTSDQNEKLRFENSRTGYRLATSVGGTATGEGGDILVIDDAAKADQGESQTQRENVIDWLDGTMSTRLNDPATGAVVVVMQRLHEQDATGHLLEQGGYTHLCLPMEYEPSHPFVWPDDPRTQPGELLWPGHFDRKAVEEIKARLGSYRAAGQLQQRPAPAAGGIFQTAWWRYYPTGWLDELDRVATTTLATETGIRFGEAMMLVQRGEELGEPVTPEHVNPTYLGLLEDSQRLDEVVKVLSADLDLDYLGALEYLEDRFNQWEFASDEAREAVTLAQVLDGTPVTLARVLTVAGEQRHELITLAASVDTAKPVGKIDVGPDGRNAVRFPDDIDLDALIADPVSWKRAERQMWGLNRGKGYVGQYPLGNDFQAEWAHYAELGFDLVASQQLRMHEDEVAKAEADALAQKEIDQKIKRAERDEARRCRACASQPTPC